MAKRSHKFHINLSIDPMVAVWGENNLKPSMSAAVENWIRSKMNIGLDTDQKLLKTTAAVVNKIAEDMIAYSKKDKRDSALKDQLPSMARGLQLIFLNDFAKKITIDQARNLLIKELKKRGFKIGS
jgi:hypothetical protein